MTLKQKFDQWITSNEILQIMYKKEKEKRIISAKIIKYDEQNQYIITYDIDKNQVHNLGLYEVEDINELKRTH